LDLLKVLPCGTGNWNSDFFGWDNPACIAADVIWEINS